MAQSNKYVLIDGYDSIHSPVLKMSNQKAVMCRHRVHAIGTICYSPSPDLNFEASAM